MSVKTELTKTIGDTRKVVDDTRKVMDDTRRVVAEAKPLYAVAGASDLGVAALRGASARLQAARSEPAVMRHRVTSSVAGLRNGVVAVQHSVQAQLAALPTAVTGMAGRLVETYDGLAKRGEKTVGRVRRQQATKDFSAQASSTASKVKAARTTARKGAAATTAQAKTAAATARKGTTAASGEVKAAAAATRKAAGKSTTATTTRAKAATTSAKKTATAGRKAATAAAGKVGKVG